jgi:hypothetical protein
MPLFGISPIRACLGELSHEQEFHATLIRFDREISSDKVHRWIGYEAGQAEGEGPWKLNTDRQ